MFTFEPCLPGELGILEQGNLIELGVAEQGGLAEFGSLKPGLSGEPGILENRVPVALSIFEDAPRLKRVFPK